jgi:DNA-binding transcriptional regulator YiaG
VNATDINSDLGTRIKTHRDWLNLSQREAAEELGISVRTLQNWEAGTITFPRPVHRRAIKRFLEKTEL